MPRELPSFHAMSVLMAGDSAGGLEDRVRSRARESHEHLFWMLCSIEQRMQHL